MTPPSHAFVVESPMLDREGRPTTTKGQIWTRSEARAKELQDQAPPHLPRTVRSVPWEEVPEKARENILRAMASAS